MSSPMMTPTLAPRRDPARSPQQDHHVPIAPLLQALAWVLLGGSPGRGAAPLAALAAPLAGLAAPLLGPGLAEMTPLGPVVHPLVDCLPPCCLRAAAARRFTTLDLVELPVPESCVERRADRRRAGRSRCGRLRADEHLLPIIT